LERRLKHVLDEIGEKSVLARRSSRPTHASRHGDTGESDIEFVVRETCRSRRS